MSRRRGVQVSIYSKQGFVLQRVNQTKAEALIADPFSGYEEINGRVTKTDYQRDRETSPTSITVAEMKMNAGEYGDPKPESRRRDGYIDPIEAAREKIAAWRSIGGLRIVTVKTT